MYANCTGSSIRFRDADGVLHAWPSSCRYTLADCQQDPNQGVAFLVPREAGTDEQLDAARQACDQYFGVPVLDHEGVTVAIRWSTGEEVSVAEMSGFRSWHNKILIIAVGSVDGVLTAAALARVITADQHRLVDDCSVQWVQAHTVDKVVLPADETLDVWLVDLAVDQRDPERTTVALLDQIQAGGHRLMGVIDEHNPAAWLERLHSDEYNALKVKPRDLTSSGAVLLSQIGEWAWVSPDDLALLHEADLADRGDFSAGRRKVVNAAIKSKITDDARRTACWEWLVGIKRRPDGSLKEVGPVSTRVPAEIAEWRNEYEGQEAHRQRCLETATIDVRGVAVFNTNGVADVSALCFEAYKRWPGHLVVLHSEVDGAPATTIAVAPGAMLDLVAIIKRQSIPVRGLALRAVVARGDAAKSIDAVVTSEAFRQHRALVGLPQAD
jgi:hypothetical protein